MINKNKIGEKGEIKAREFLINKNYTILSSNWRYQHKEIDLIAQKDNTLVIVEVKTRTSNYISPKESVRKKKQQNLIIAANAYVQINNLDIDVRFDIIEVIIQNKEYTVNHIKEAFYPLL